VETTIPSLLKARPSQELVFDVARTLTRDFVQQRESEVPLRVLFPELLHIVDRYVRQEVALQPPGDLRDLQFASYNGWLVEVLLEAVRPDAANSKAPETARFEATRGLGSTAEVDFWTKRHVREITQSHINYVVVDTRNWEQTAAYYIDTHPSVRALVKNAGLRFAIPYLHNGQMHDYQPDLIIRLDAPDERYLIVQANGPSNGSA
jgi:type III restriction enzyme